MKEYEVNLKINRDGQEKLNKYKERIKDLEELEETRNSQAPLFKSSDCKI